ncbi:MAG: Fic family protein [Deltaproteobacteria bacterium]|nr:Fic family protein [Deltaproteobacteria bacterium]MBI2534793.1 Fic family protein [Deltaproteobacteria bacterium]MBI3065735.1 Fic family protein [Deltaproteobacteria bacterium]
MKTLEQFASKPETIQVSTSWYLADLGEARGKQELFTKQSPQKLKVLREHALIESAVSSNRIEGVRVDEARVATVIFGKSLLRDRDEEEVRGYRDALKLIHEQGRKLQISEETIKRLHRMIRGDIWDAGKYKQQDSDIIEKYPDGRERVRFKAVTAADTSAYMHELVALWRRALRERWVHPLIALAAFNLDFLCIHPFRDGNGRISRLLLLLQCYHLGFEVGRYISIERLIEENKERYYETLEQSSRGWHGGKHDPWSYVNYLLYILKSAYKEFEERVDKTTSPKGAKTELVIAAISRFPGAFRVSDIQRQCPGVSVDLIRQILKTLRSSGRVKCLGRGQSAEWQRSAKWK